VHGGLLTDVVQSQPPAARVHGRPERQQNDLICMAADLPESVHAAAQIETSLLSSVSPWFLRALALIVFFFGIGHWP
jgi:hypothetical protein